MSQYCVKTLYALLYVAQRAFYQVHLHHIQQNNLLSIMFNAYNRIICHLQTKYSRIYSTVLGCYMHLHMLLVYCDNTWRQNDVLGGNKSSVSFWGGKYTLFHVISAWCNDRASIISVFIYFKCRMDFHQDGGSLRRSCRRMKPLYGQKPNGTSNRSIGKFRVGTTYVMSARLFFRNHKYLSIW